MANVINKLMKSRKYYPSVTIEAQCGCGSVFVTLVRDGENVIHSDIHGAKWGTCMAVAMYSNLSLINSMIESGKNMKDVIGEINNLHCFKIRKDNESNRLVYSCVDAISHAIQYYLNNVSAA